MAHLYLFVFILASSVPLGIMKGYVCMHLYYGASGSQHPPSFYTVDMS